MGSFSLNTKNKTVHHISLMNKGTEFRGTAVSSFSHDKEKLARKDASGEPIATSSSCLNSWLLK